jgi:CheY-like chemotaxis protein
VASTIFVIDSSPAVRRMVEEVSVPEGFEVVGFQDGPAALEAARRISPHLIIADYHLDNITFSGFCKEVHKLDNLSETYIVTLVSPSDRLDENQMRSWGVKASLAKPFQADNLIDVIKDLEEQHASQTNVKKKSRTWPPVFSSTDSDDDLELGAGLDDGHAEEEETQAIIPPANPKPKDTPVTTAAKTSSSAPEPEDAMKGLFGQMLQSMSERTEKKINELLPQMVSKDLASHVAKAVEAEVRTQMGASLSQERLTQILEPLLTKELPKILKQEMPTLEPIIRHSIFEIASPLIKEQIEQLVHEQADLVRTKLPDLVREQLGSVEELVKKEIEQAVAKQAADIVEGVVRTAAEQQVEQTVLKLVPSIAEKQVKTEIQRLTTAA